MAVGSILVVWYTYTIEGHFKQEAVAIENGEFDEPSLTPPALLSQPTTKTIEESEQSTFQRMDTITTEGNGPDTEMNQLIRD